MEYIVNLLQLAGGIILSVGYFPQIKRVLKTKSVEDFSFTYLLMLVIGIGLMEIYAVYNLILGIAIMFFVTNTISFILAILMLGLYLKFRKKVK